MSHALEEEVAPFSVLRSQTPMATSFRSTWLTSSIRAIRDRKLLDAYLGALPKAHHEDVLGSVAGVWLPIEVAMAHYAACDSLLLSLQDQIAIGRAVTTFAHRTSYNLAIRMVREAGVTPWACFAIEKRLWQQVWRGVAWA